MKKGSQLGLMGFISAECDNYKNGDKCIGLNALGTERFNKTGFCLVARGRRCPYFEAAVLPILNNKQYCDNKSVYVEYDKIRKAHKAAASPSTINGKAALIGQEGVEPSNIVAK